MLKLSPRQKFQKCAKIVHYTHLCKVTMVLLFHICTKYQNFQSTFTSTTSNDPKNKLPDCIYQGIQFFFLCKGRNFQLLYRSLHYTELFSFSPLPLNTHLHPHQRFEHFQLSLLTGFKELVGKHM